MADIDSDTLLLATAQCIAAKRVTEFYDDIADTISGRNTGDGDMRGAVRERVKSGASHLNRNVRMSDVNPTKFHGI
jgi:hypothetical protein